VLVNNKKKPSYIKTRLPGPTPSPLQSEGTVNQKQEPLGNTLLAQRCPFSGNIYFWRTGLRLHLDPPTDDGDLPLGITRSKDFSPQGIKSDTIILPHRQTGLVLDKNFQQFVPRLQSIFVGDGAPVKVVAEQSVARQMLHFARSRSTGTLIRC
jgi:hypothetical protein